MFARLRDTRVGGFARGVRRRYRGTEIFEARRHERALKAWRTEGCPIPSPGDVKIAEILAYVERLGPRVFIETGTYRGATTNALKRHVEKAYTIELSPRLAGLARVRFAADPNVEVLQGDSAELLPKVLETLWEPALFWLDGHWSGGETARSDLETPLHAELDAILAHRETNHVVLIDDARHLGTGDYPSLADIEARIRTARPHWIFEVRHDIIRAHPDVPWSSTGDG